MHKIVNGERVELAEAEVSARQAEERVWATEQAATEHLRKRQEEAPGLQAQLDMLRKDGLQAYTDHMNAIDAKHPAPA